MFICQVVLGRGMDTESLGPPFPAASKSCLRIEEPEDMGRVLRFRHDRAGRDGGGLGSPIILSPGKHGWQGLLLLGVARQYH